MRYELLGRHPGLRVSELVLGAGMFGTKWGYGGGLLTSKYRKGGNGRQAAMGGRLFTAEDTGQRTAILDTLEVIADDLSVQPVRLP
jgi:aryl-alcohol dehydrogenase-like predicted oxidoreductase